MNDFVIKTNDLTKQYGEQKSVANLSIHVKKGRIYGLLGRNGAGKTTTMKMLLGLTNPTSGEVRIFGKDIRTDKKKILSRVGNLIESPGFYPNLLARKTLRLWRGSVEYRAATPLKTHWMSWDCLIRIKNCFHSIRLA